MILFLSLILSLWEFITYNNIIPVFAFTCFPSIVNSIFIVSNFSLFMFSLFITVVLWKVTNIASEMNVVYGYQNKK